MCGAFRSHKPTLLGNCRERKAPWASEQLRQPARVSRHLPSARHVSGGINASLPPWLSPPPPRLQTWTRFLRCTLLCFWYIITFSCFEVLTHLSLWLYLNVYALCWLGKSIFYLSVAFISAQIAYEFCVCLRLFSFRFILLQGYFVCASARIGWKFVWACLVSSKLWCSHPLACKRT